MLDGPGDGRQLEGRGQAPATPRPARPRSCRARRRPAGPARMQAGVADDPSVPASTATMKASGGMPGRSTSRARNSARSPTAIGSSPPGMSAKVSRATAWTPGDQVGPLGQRVSSRPSGASTAGGARPASSRRTAFWRSSSVKPRGPGSRSPPAGAPGSGSGARSCRASAATRARASSRTRADAPAAGLGQHAEGRPQVRVVGCLDVDPTDRGGPDGHAVELGEEAHRARVGGVGPAHVPRAVVGSSGVVALLMAARVARSVRRVGRAAGWPTGPVIARASRGAARRPRGRPRPRRRRRDPAACPG